MSCLEKPDLTGAMKPAENADVLSDLAAAMPEATREARELPELPDGWIPSDAVVFVVAELNDGRWEAVLPEYSVVAMGDNLHGAVHEAGELLNDYLRMCYMDGQTFREAYRPIPMRWALPLMARSLFWALINGLWRGRPARRRRLRYPVDHVTC